MIEKKVPCDTYQVHAMCECGGEFHYDYNSFTFDTFPSYTSHRHVCDKCGKVENFGDKYPTIRFESKEEDSSFLVEDD